MLLNLINLTLLLDHVTIDKNAIVHFFCSVMPQTEFGLQPFSTAKISGKEI